MSNSSPGPIVFAPASENQSKIYAVIATELERRGIATQFLTFDAFYNQGAQYALATLGRSSISLSVPYSIGEWCDCSDEQRNELLKASTPSIFDVLAELKPSAVVITNDTGAIEQLLVRFAEILGAQSVCVQDGAMSPSTSRPAGSFSAPQILTGGARLICVWSDFLEATLRHRGVGAKVIVGGNPRYDKVPARAVLKGPLHRILVAHQCFARHGSMSAGQEVAITERMVRQVLSRGDTEVILKLHPQTVLCQQYLDLEKEFAPGKLRVIQGGELLEYLAGVSALITVTSTASIDSVLMGIPSYRLSYIFGRSPDFLSGEREYLSWLRDENFPTPVQASIDFCNDLHRPLDGKNTQRVVDGILALCKPHPAPPPLDSSTSCDASMIVVGTSEFPSAVFAALSERESNLEILYLDYSPNGEVRRQLEKAIPDPRLRFIDSAGSLISGLNKARREARAQTIIRCHPSTVFLPGMIWTLARESRDNPNFAAVSGWYLLRDEFGVVRSQISPPEVLTGSSTSWDFFSSRVVEAYAFGRDSLGAIEWTDAAMNYDLDFISRRITECQRGVSVIPKILFLSSWRLPISLEKYVSRENPRKQLEWGQRGEKIAVICAFYDSDSEVRSLCSALKKQTADPSTFEVFVPVLNAGSRTQAILREYSDTLNIQTVEAPSLGAARNKALSFTGAEIIVLLGPGLVPHPNWISAFQSVFQSRATPTSVVTGAVVTKEGDADTLLAMALKTPDLVSGFSPLSGSMSPVTAWIPGTNCAISRALLTSCSPRPFSETPYVEDLNCYLNIKRQGAVPMYEPAAIATSSRAYSLSSFITRERDLAIQFLSRPDLMKDSKLCLGLFSMENLDEAALSEIRGERSYLVSVPDALCKAIGNLHEERPRTTSDAERRNTQAVVHRLAETLKLLALQTRLAALAERL